MNDITTELSGEVKATSHVGDRMNGYRSSGKIANGGHSPIEYTQNSYNGYNLLQKGENINPQYGAGNSGPVGGRFDPNPQNMNGALSQPGGNGNSQWTPVIKYHSKLKN